jgi:DNA-binding NarL/FixJ family response regulator
MGDCGTILVIDHDAGARAAAGRAADRLGYTPCAFESSELALERLGSERPALAIVEVELPRGASGLELVRELHARYGDDLPVILVSAERTEALDRVAGLLLGADDYLAKPFDESELVARMRRSLRHAAASGNGGGDGGQLALALSPREREILELLADGKSSQEIASTLVLSPKTVATHVQRVLSKLGVHSRAQAVALAYRSGLLRAEVEAHALAGEPLAAE